MFQMEPVQFSSIVWNQSLFVNVGTNRTVTVASPVATSFKTRRSEPLSSSFPDVRVISCWLCSPRR
jgi:hypothetical protein